MTAPVLSTPSIGVGEWGKGQRTVTIQDSRRTAEEVPVDSDGIMRPSRHAGETSVGVALPIPVREPRG